MTTDRLDIRHFEDAVARLEEDISKKYQDDPTRMLCATVWTNALNSPANLPKDHFLGVLPQVQPNSLKSVNVEVQERGARTLPYAHSCVRRT
jgi:hypothetical protein